MLDEFGLRPIELKAHTAAGFIDNVIEIIQPPCLVGKLRGGKPDNRVLVFCFSMPRLVRIDFNESYSAAPAVALIKGLDLAQQLLEVRSGAVSNGSGLQPRMPVRSKRFTGLLRQSQILAGLLSSAQIPERYFFARQRVVVLQASWNASSGD